MRFKMVLALILLAVSPPAWTAEYRVNPDTIASFETQTLPKLAPGDRVWFGDGLYARSAEFRITRSGKEDARIVFEAEHSGLAFFQGPPVTGPYPDQTKMWHGFNVRASYVTLRGLRVSRAPFNGIVVAGKGNLVEECEATECGYGKLPTSSGGEGALISGVSEDTILRKSRFKRNREHGAYLTASKHTTVEDCDLSENDSCGLETNGAAPQPGSYRHVIRNNRLNNNKKRGLNLLIMRDSLVEGNQIFGNGSYAVSLSQGSTGNTFRENQFGTNTRACISINQGGNFGRSTGNTFTGNTYYLVKTVPTARDLEGDFADSTFTDNKTVDLTSLRGMHPKIATWLASLLNDPLVNPILVPDSSETAEPVP